MKQQYHSITENLDVPVNKPTACDDEPTAKVQVVHSTMDHLIVPVNQPTACDEPTATVQVADTENKIVSVDTRQQKDQPNEQCAQDVNNKDKHADSENEVPKDYIPSDVES